MTDTDIAEAIADLPDSTIGVVAEHKPHVDGLPYRVVAIRAMHFGSRPTPLQYFATAHEADCVAERINQHLIAVRRLTT